MEVTGAEDEDSAAVAGTEDLARLSWTRIERGVQLFASNRNEPRSRRPTDIALVMLSFTSLVLVAALSHIGANIDQQVSELLASFPNLFDALWLLLLWTPVAWTAVLLVASVVRLRFSLTRDLVAAAITSLVLALVTANLATDVGWRGLRDLTSTHGPPSFPPVLVVLTVAAISTASPHLSRPWRYFGRWIVFGQLTAVLFLGMSLISGGMAAIALGLLASALVHLVVGSPGGRPTTSRILAALRELGIEARELEPVPVAVQGVVRFVGRDDHGPLAIKVYGRDAWDGQLLTSLWRAAWYRGSYRTARLSRAELVEHEGFMTLLADRAGLRVPVLVRAGSAGGGDALVVVRPEGEPLEEPLPVVDEAGVASLWQELGTLHRAGLAFRWLDLDRSALRPDGSLGLADFSAASLIQAPADLLGDLAQALALSALLLGEDEAAGLCRRTVGDEGFLEVLPYVQEAAMPPAVLAALRHRKIDLDGVRARMSEAVGAPEQPLEKLRRVTVGSLVNLGLVVIAAITLVGLLGQLDLATFWDELSHASWWWLAFALLLAQLPRVPSAISTMGSLEAPLPLGPLTALQFAICYVNLAIPSTAARVAVNVRFFERLGIKPTTAVSAGAIDSVSGFVVQIALFLTLFGLADVHLGLSDNLEDLSGALTLVLIVVGVAVVSGIVALLIPSVRRRIVTVVREAGTALRVLRQPRKLVQLFGGNLAAQVLFGVALSTCVYAFGEQVPLGEILLINTVVSLFAGLLPVPGGIGVSEAGLTYGLTAAGLSVETAAAAALAYRFTSFYLPPLWGFGCYRWLVKRRYL
ncbi:MAG TPA: lysylphosphatidylglycerol synthase transmembrane domain-containing protein [Acidimicrobiales bacterium]